MDLLLTGLFKGLFHLAAESRRWWSWLPMLVMPIGLIAIGIHFGDYASYRANWPLVLLLFALASFPLVVRTVAPLYRHLSRSARSGNTLARELRLRRLRP
jgi:hypothetical protein